MTILRTLYASGGTQVIHPTLEITDGVESYFLTNGFSDLTATLEDARTVTFTACGMDVALPKRDSNGAQDLRFALSNIDGAVSRFVRTALSESREILVVYRQFLSDDLGAPAEAPYRFKVKSGSISATEAQLTAGYFDLLSTGWPRKRYTLNFAPGIRYL